MALIAFRRNLNADANSEMFTYRSTVLFTQENYGKSFDGGWLITLLMLFTHWFDANENGQMEIGLPR